MTSLLRAAFIAISLVLLGCAQHHQDFASVPAQPLGSTLKFYPRAALVAMPADVPPLSPGSAPSPAVTSSPVAITSLAPPPTVAPVPAPGAAPAPDGVPPDTAPDGTPLSPGSSSTGANPENVTSSDTSVPAVAPPPLSTDQVAILHTAAGEIVIELDDFAAPKTCKNFRELVADGFYNNTVFHRVIPNFIIQGGDPNSKSYVTNRDTYGLGGPGYTLPPEISLRHDRGAVAMARLPDSVDPQRESNGSQFYICLAPSPTLDGQYTVFGHVIKGMEVADAIAGQPRDRRDNPLKRIEITATLKSRAEALPGSATAPMSQPNP